MNDLFSNAQQIRKPAVTSKGGIVAAQSRKAAEIGAAVLADGGEYHPQPEWCENIPHPVEQTRGQTASGDAYSPGWFELPLPKGAAVNLTITAEDAANNIVTAYTGAHNLTFSGANGAPTANCPK